MNKILMIVIVGTVSFCNLTGTIAVTKYPDRPKDTGTTTIQFHDKGNYYFIVCPNSRTFTLPKQ